MTINSYLKLNLATIENSSSILSLKKFIQSQILTFLAQISDIFTESLFLTDIPLVSTITDTHLIYRSAIALKLAQKSFLNPEILADKLFNTLINTCCKSENTINLTVQIQLIDQVWLVFYLDFYSIQHWLNVLSKQVDYLPPRSLTIGITEPLIAGYCQYAHARASALLRLAEQEKVFSLPILALTEPSTQLNLSPPERSLLEQILKVSDQLEETKKENWLKIARNLSESFLGFERHSRLFSNKNCPKKQFRWLLLINTRFLLQIILLTKLKISAPDEL